jgi:NADPH:quinone reductase-like Zn-dependent oxidoreductase
MTTMRAMAIDGPGEPDVLRERELPVPTPAIGEALVRVAAAGVNPIDAKTRAGRGAAALIREYPAVLGVDFCGTIERPAFDAHPFQPGDAVYGLVSVPRLSGSYAECLTVPVVAIARAPRSLTPVQAAAVPCAALTAWGCIVTVGAVQPAGACSSTRRPAGSATSPCSSRSVRGRTSWPRHPSATPTG